MCKHILNAQVAVRAPCCQRFFDCPQCHAESSDHPLRKTTEMAFVCKACKRAFRKDLAVFEESDEYCPWCDNCYVVGAQTGSSKRRGRDRGEQGEEVDTGGGEASLSSSSRPPDARHDSSLYEALDPRVKYDPRVDFHTTSSRATEAGERIESGGLRGVVEEKEYNQAQAEKRVREIMQLAGMTGRGGAGEGIQGDAAAGDVRSFDDELDWS